MFKIFNKVELFVATEWKPDPTIVELTLTSSRRSEPSALLWLLFTLRRYGCLNTSFEDEDGDWMHTGIEGIVPTGFHLASDRPYGC
jgi:hypothetical protein